MNQIKAIITTLLREFIQFLRTSSGFLKAMMLIFVAGLAAILYRYLFGIGSISNLNDSYPWGLWISFDVLCGVALAAGGFTTAGVVHIFGGKKYEPLARPAILTAFLGYLLVIGALWVDLGRPWKIWHPMVLWQPHSVMFEVGWCVTLYTIVLAIEFSPAFFEKFGMEKARNAVRGFYIPGVIAGMILSTLHQSSLGSLFLIVPHKLSPIWWTPILPIMFFLSAVAVGLAMVIFESTIAAKAFKRESEIHLLKNFGRAIPWVLMLYLTMKIGDLVARNQVMRVFEFNGMAISFWMELLIGILLPIAILTQRDAREDGRLLFGAASCVIAGVVLNRFNVSMIGMHVETWQSYFPHALEVLVTACVISAGIIIYAFIVKHFPIWHDAAHAGPSAE
jgi:Ni/Fe-hydrogenase subunit HybB-like protein